LSIIAENDKSERSLRQPSNNQLQRLIYRQFMRENAHFIPFIAGAASFSEMKSIYTFQIQI
jgi:hypothetical protein